MTKIRTKGNSRPYANNESLKQAIIKDIKHAFNDVSLDVLVEKIIDVFNKFDPIKIKQLESYQEELINTKKRLQKNEQIIILFGRIFILLVAIILLLFFLVIYFFNS